MEKFPLTKQGFLALEEELKNLKGVERPNIIAAIAEARSHGDLSENAEYSAAKEKQSFIEGRIQDLEAVLSRAQVIDVSGTKSDVIRFGATVLVADEDTDDEKDIRLSAITKLTLRKTKFRCPRLWPRPSSAKKSATPPNMWPREAKNPLKFWRLNIFKSLVS